MPRHFDILFEDESVLVIDKPAGLPMHTTAKFWRNTLVAVLRERYPDEQMEIATASIARRRACCSSRATGGRERTSRARSRAAPSRRRTWRSSKGHPPDEGKIDVPLKSARHEPA